MAAREPLPESISYRVFAERPVCDQARTRLFVQLSGTAMGIALDHLERGRTSDAADMLRSTLRCVAAFLEEA